MCAIVLIVSLGRCYFQLNIIYLMHSLDVVVYIFRGIVMRSSSGTTLDFKSLHINCMPCFRWCCASGIDLAVKYFSNCLGDFRLTFTDCFNFWYQFYVPRICCFMPWCNLNVQKVKLIIANGLKKRVSLSIVKSITVNCKMVPTESGHRIPWKIQRRWLHLTACHCSETLCSTRLYSIKCSTLYYVH